MKIMSERDLEQKLKCNGFDTSTSDIIFEGLSYITDYIEDCDLVVDYLLGQKERMLLEQDERTRLIKEEESIKQFFGV